MRKADIKPGVLYAYKHFGPRDMPEPIMFFSDYPWLHTLYHLRSGTAPELPLFVRALPGAKPVSGNGVATTGYPAVTLEGSPSDVRLERLLGVTLKDFEATTSVHGQRRTKFLIVARLATVVCKWKDREQ